MADTNPAQLIQELHSRLTNLGALLKSDAVWAPIAEELLQSRDPEFQKRFWLAMEADFKGREADLGHLHKGQIYWNLAILNLGGGDLSESLRYLDLARDEDHQRGDAFSAAIGLSSVVRPLVYRFKRDSWKFDDAIMAFYELLTKDEREHFAQDLVGTHNMAATGSLQVIKPDFFTFIADPSKRRVCQSTYQEIFAIIRGGTVATFYSCIFSTGSILEGMLDDLFERDNQRIWKLLRDDPAVMEHVEAGSRLRRSADYDSGMTLGEKIMILRLLGEHARSPIPRAVILLMLIVAEYRDLIHPRRRLEFEFEANAYVAAYVFTLVSVLASHWWPHNVELQLEGEAK